MAIPHLDKLLEMQVEAWQKHKDQADLVDVVVWIQCSNLLQVAKSGVVIGDNNDPHVPPQPLNALVVHAPASDAASFLCDRYMELFDEGALRLSQEFTHKDACLLTRAS